MIDTDAQVAYGIFWSAYAIAFVVFFYMMKQLFRYLPLYGVRTLLSAALVALLLTPVESPELADWWIPAWLYGGYELVLGETEPLAGLCSISHCRSGDATGMDTGSRPLPSGSTLAEGPTTIRMMP